MKEKRNKKILFSQCQHILNLNSQDRWKDKQVSAELESKLKWLENWVLELKSSSQSLILLLIYGIIQQIYMLHIQGK
jgi:hypothetical protein